MAEIKKLKTDWGMCSSLGLSSPVWPVKPEASRAPEDRSNRSWSLGFNWVRRSMLERTPHNILYPINYRSMHSMLTLLVDKITVNRPSIRLRDGDAASDESRKPERRVFLLWCIFSVTVKLGGGGIRYLIFHQSEPEYPLIQCKALHFKTSQVANYQLIIAD